MLYPSIVFIYSPLLVAQTVAGIAAPFAMGRFIDALVNKTAPLEPFAVLAALLLARAALTPCIQRLVISRARDVELKLQERVLDAVMDFQPSEISPLASGELVAKLTRDAYAVGRFISGLYPRVIVAIVTMLASGAALYSRSATLGFFFVAFIPLAIAMFLPFARRFSENSHSVRKKSDCAFSTLFDFFRSLPFLRTLDAERRFRGAPYDAMTALKEGNGSMDRLTIVFGALLGAILVVGEIAVLGAIGTLAAKGAVPVGYVVVYQMLFLAAMQSVQGIVSLLPETASLREGVDSLDEILSHPPPKHGGVKADAIKCIDFQNITFSYPGAENRPVVNNFSATFRAGRIYALIGANGTGKTTLLKLATAALEPQKGEILVNGVPLKALDEGAFRRKTGIVFQDGLLVTGTIRDNITMRDPSFGDDAIEAAIAASGLEDVLKRLPDGLDTRIGLHGQSLSGGELQRLAIARALVRNPSLLVLDEVTNHLDAQAHAAFWKRLRSLAPNRIILLVTHDASLVNLCDDTIIVAPVTASTS